jgi:hypothetical protein
MGFGRKIEGRKISEPEALENLSTPNLSTQPAFPSPLSNLMQGHRFGGKEFVS